MNRMNLNQLKVFYLAVKCGSFSAAAESLFITQPAVTKQIQQLQASYGVKLLNRFGRKMVLTDAGQALYELAEQIFQIETLAEEKLHDFQEQKSGRIRIHTSESFGAYYLPSIIHLFREAYPQIHISVVVFYDEQIVENTVKLENDLGFVSTPIEHEKLVLKEVLEDRIVLIVPLSHPFARRSRLAPRDLEGQPLIMHEKQSATRTIVDDFVRSCLLSINMSLELSNNEAIKRAVEDGLGISLISENVVREEVRCKRLKAIRMTSRSLKRKFYMIYRKDKYISPHLQSFIENVHQWSGEHFRASS